MKSEDREKEYDCCKNKPTQKLRGDVKLYVLLGMVGLVLLLSVVQSFQIRELKNKAAVATVTSGASAGDDALDTTGWTDDEKMMYEHHGIVPDRLKGSGVTSAQSGASKNNGMVGGC